MRTLRIVALTATVVSCHLDKLLNAGGGAPATSHGTPVQLMFAAVPRGARAGRPFGPVRVSVADSVGQPVAGDDSATVTVVLGSAPTGATLSGTATAHPVHGVATFPDLRLDKASAGYTLIASTDGLRSDTSDAFAVDPGPVTQLRFTVQPDTAAPNAAITPPVEVTAYDSLDNKATNFTGAIRVSLGQDGSVAKNARLSGATAANAVAGVATFANLRLNQTGVGYTLKAAVSSAPPLGESAQFNVLPVPPPPPPVGNIAITTSTTGQNFDPDGYTVTLDGGTSSHIGINTNITLSSVAAGDHSLSLSGVASNCAVTSANPQTVTVPSGATAQASFAITCAAPPFGGATHLVFTDDPQTVQVGQVMPPVRATVYDGSDNEVAGFIGTVTIEIDSNPGNGTLSTARKTIQMNNPVAQWRRDRAGVLHRTDHDARGQCDPTHPRRRADRWQPQHELQRRGVDHPLVQPHRRRAVRHPPGPGGERVCRLHRPAHRQAWQRVRAARYLLASEREVQPGFHDLALGQASVPGLTDATSRAFTLFAVP